MYIRVMYMYVSGQSLLFTLKRDSHVNLRNVSCDVGIVEVHEVVGLLGTLADDVLQIKDDTSL